ncbi:hypothetical protein [Flavobacterium sp.]|uniref:hypothetical protein n=1 Tax=Flavobacterium sp. TaxID=239 RepID=UPI002D8898B4|nr:hypothetical protein [Flavobacterium sp.]
MIRECYNLLKNIESRPAMFIGEVTLNHLKIFISGYYLGICENKIIKESVNQPFNEWIAKKLNYYESTAGWANMILAYSLGINPRNIVWEEVFNLHITKEQHLNSVHLFYKLLEEYKIVM